MVRTVLSMFLMLVLGGSVLLADDTKQQKETKKKKLDGPTAEITKYDAEKGSITATFASAQKTYKVDKDAKVFDAKGKEIKDGLKDKGLTTGARVRLVFDKKSKSVKEVHLVKTRPEGEERRSSKLKEAQRRERKTKDGKEGDKKKDDDKKKDEDKKEDKK